LGDELASSLGRFSIQQVLPDLGAMRAEELNVFRYRVFHVKIWIPDQDHDLDAAGETCAATFNAEYDAVAHHVPVRQQSPVQENAGALLKVRWCELPGCKKTFYQRRATQRFCNGRHEQQWRNWDPKRQAAKAKHYLEHGTANRKRLLEKRRAHLEKLARGTAEERLEAYLRRKKERSDGKE
jgi:hypothetical protein